MEALLKNSEQNVLLKRIKENIFIYPGFFIYTQTEVSFRIRYASSPILSMKEVLLEISIAI